MAGMGMVFWLPCQTERKPNQGLEFGVWFRFSGLGLQVKVGA